MSKNNKKNNTAPEKEEEVKTPAEAENKEETAEETAANAEQSEQSEKKTPEEKPAAPAKRKKSVNPRKLKHGALSVVLTLVFIAAVVVLNIIVGIISDRVNTTADLTAGNIYSLDDKTKNYLENTLANDVTITVLAPEQKFEDQDSSYKQVNEILKRMEMESSHVSLDYLDVDQNPNYTAKFKGETLAANYIVVECEKTDRYKIISPYDYFQFNQQYLQYYGAYVVEGSNIEQEAVSAMMFTTNDSPVRVAFTEGSSESDSSALQSLLAKNGYDVETINLTTTEIDADIDYIIIYAPKLDLDNFVLSKIDKFLDNNGKFEKNVLYFASAQQPKTPNIDNFLSDWGLSIGYDVIGQSDSKYTVNPQDLYIHLQQICETDYTKSVYSTNLFTFGADMRPVYLLETGGADQDVLMKTYSGAFLYPLDKELANTFEYDKAKTGEFNVVAAANKVTADGSYSRVCAVGSEYLASGDLMSYSNSNNAEFFVGIFNYISGREQGITIKAKSYMPVTFEMNVKTANSLTIVLCIVVPVLVILLGIVIWVLRRHR